MLKIYLFLITHEYYHWISFQLISNTHLLIYFNEVIYEQYIFIELEGKNISQIISDF